jgi:hypothetical protein
MSRESVTTSLPASLPGSQLLEATGRDPHVLSLPTREPPHARGQVVTSAQDDEGTRPACQRRLHLGVVAGLGCCGSSPPTHASKCSMQAGPWFCGLLTVVLTGTAFMASLGNGLSKDTSSSFGLGVGSSHAA